MTEQSLAAAVVAQAYDDYCAGPPSKANPFGYGERLNDYREAVLFCTAERGAWARSRRDWCALAGIDEDAFRRKCAERLESTS